MGIQKIILAQCSKVLSAALLLMAIAGCGGGSATITSEITDGDNGTIPSPNELISALPEDDAFSQRDASSITSASAIASSSYPGRAASEAFDGNGATFWTGGVSTSTWTLEYVFPTPVRLQKTSVTFHSALYIPGSTTLSVSPDGTTWTNVGTAASPDNNPTFSFAEVSALRLRLTMTGRPSKGAPSVREVDWVQPLYNDGGYADSNQNSSVYFASKMFDANPATYWVGKSGLSSWNIYYCFSESRHIELVTVKYQSLYYVPASADLSYSVDGENWTAAGNLSPGNSSFGRIGDAALCVRIAMNGAPSRGMPAISEIYFDLQPGGASADNYGPNYHAAYALDGNTTTTWTGKTGQSTWSYYYSFPQRRSINSATIHWASYKTYPSSTTLSISDDGEHWLSAATFPNATDATVSITGAKAKYLKISMSGVPISGKPIIREIEFSSSSMAYLKTRMSICSTHACAITSTGSVKCWGNNYSGQLGDGTYVNSTTPVSVEGITDAVSVSVNNAHIGGAHSCALLSGGGIKCWGNNDFGQLGDGSTDSSPSPVYVSGITDAVSISSGTDSTCAISSGGEAKCWGANDITLEAILTPRLVPGVSDVVAISAGGWHTCVVTGGGEVKCWGSNMNGNLGDGSSSDYSLTPVTVAGIADAINVSSSWHTCALLKSGGVKCWGAGSEGQLGAGAYVNSSIPIAVAGISDAVEVINGDGSSCAILKSGNIKCWGYNGYGKLGNGNTSSQSSPVSVLGLDNAVAVGNGESYTCSLLSSGAAKCWGNNWAGNLGDGTNVSSMSPVTVLGF